MIPLIIVYLLGRRLFPPRGGLIALGYASISLLHIYYSQEVRTYPLVMVLAPPSMYTFLLGAETKHLAPWAVHTAANALLAGTHVMGARWQNMNPEADLPFGLSIEPLFALLVICLSGVYLIAALIRARSHERADVTTFRRACLIVLWLVIPHSLSSSFPILGSAVISTAM